MGKKEINIMTCSENELDLFFAKLKQDFANKYPVHVLDCERIYMPVVNVSEHAMKEKTILSPFKSKKSLWDMIQAKLQVSNFSLLKSFQKWKKD
jgi:hypothetical protein